MSLLKFLTSQTFFKHLGLALVVFLILFYGFTQWLKNTTNHNEFRKVPNLVGKKMDLAKSLLEERDLVLGDVEYKDYDPKFPKGAIVEHMPAANDKVKEGRKIYITVNRSEHKKITIPKLKDQTKRQAESRLRALGFQIGAITYKPHFAKDVILELKYNNKVVDAGIELPYTSVIDLVLGDGKLDYGEQSNSDTSSETPLGNSSKQVDDNDGK